MLPATQEGQAQPLYLHAADVDGQDCGEEQHLEEEVRHQAHNREETELLEQSTGPVP